MTSSQDKEKIIDIGAKMAKWGALHLLSNGLGENAHLQFKPIEDEAQNHLKQQKVMELAYDGYLLP